MTYFLDFDRTLFDTDSHYVHLIDDAVIPEPYRTTLVATKNAGAGHTDYTAEAWQRYQEGIERGIIKHGDGASGFLYPDALPFLARHGADTVIVTFGLPAIQRAKVEGSGIVPLVKRVIYTGLDEKALEGENGTPDSVFVDDQIRHLETVAQAHPSMRLFEIRRDGKPGSGTFPVVRSLAELP